MSVEKGQMISDVQAIISIVAGTASLVQQYQVTTFTRCRCPNCSRTFWKLVRNKCEYLSSYPFCPGCGAKTELKDIEEDHDVIGAEAFLLQKGNSGYASFKIRRKALETANLKKILQTCDVQYLS